MRALYWGMRWMLPEVWLAQVDGSAAGAPNVFTYFGQSNLAGQVIVVGLVCFSLIAWTVMVGKFLDLARLRAANQEFERRLALLPGLLHLEPSRRPMARGPYARLLREALEALDRASEVGATTEGQMHHAENALQRGVSAVVIHYESKMILLATLVSGSPLMGLLGTVWGVMDAFGAVALRSTATLQALAPGVSGALLTTVAGLLVAIPSVFGYNYLLTQTKLMVTELENYASELADRLENELREHSGTSG